MYILAIHVHECPVDTWEYGVGIELRYNFVEDKKSDKLNLIIILPIHGRPIRQWWSHAGLPRGVHPALLPRHCYLVLLANLSPINIFKLLNNFRSRSPNSEPDSTFLETSLIHFFKKIYKEFGNVV
jgi:hypothetical protein